MGRPGETTPVKKSKRMMFALKPYGVCITEKLPTEVFVKYLNFIILQTLKLNFKII